MFVRRNKVLWIILILVVSGSVVSAGRGTVLTIMSANITSGNYQAYEAAGIRIFQGLHPDIVLIQEFNYEHGSLRDLVDEAFGPEYEYVVEPGGEDIPNGIISRYPIIASGDWPDSHLGNRDYAWAVIDIPGDIDLQVVSVHLKAGSGDAGTRLGESSELKDYIQSHFDAGQYIVVGGDMNTSTASESALMKFNEYLVPFHHVPVDNVGNRNTNESRTKPYDWVIPNDVLDACHVPLVIGSNTFDDGLVFDSAVYEPLGEVSPVQPGDSHVSGMQHMAVMKAFLVGDGPPPDTPTPASTPTSPPTATPTTPPGEPTSTPAPEPTATPSADAPHVALLLDRNIYHPGNRFYLRMLVMNDRTGLDTSVFVVLDAGGVYFFYPSWSTDIDWEPLRTFPGMNLEIPILDFTWPDGCGAGSGLWFYGALADPVSFELLSNLASVTFSYTD